MYLIFQLICHYWLLAKGDSLYKNVYYYSFHFRYLWIILCHKIWHYNIRTGFRGQLYDKYSIYKNCISETNNENTKQFVAIARYEWESDFSSIRRFIVNPGFPHNTDWHVLQSLTGNSFLSKPHFHFKYYILFLWVILVIMHGLDFFFLQLCLM